MKRAMILSLVLSMALGGWAMAQCSCLPTTRPATPRCYVSFQQCQQIEIGLRTPRPFFPLFCCSPCAQPAAPNVVGWRVETLEGVLVYEQELYAPASGSSFSAVWDQVDMDGQQVAPGYYEVSVVTQDGIYSKHLRILDRCQFVFPFFSFGCSTSACGPDVSLSRYVPPRPPSTCCMPCLPSPCLPHPCCP